ncbi:hypothetical protein [Curvibacter microcysteis]|uniref:hypothetical protein n=1 Tax=Curvibacter microcysteis TaxID=3026419 RepID=UPI00235DC4E2|nr:hypothetical protein [Curvibacter sp. HBC28]
METIDAGQEASSAAVENDKLMTGGLLVRWRTAGGTKRKSILNTQFLEAWP